MMRHLLVALAGLLVASIALGAALAVSAGAAGERLRVTAVFPPGTSETELFLRVAAAEGRIIQGTPLPFAVEVMGDAPGIAGRLEAMGAWLVLSELPTSLLAVGGCVSSPMGLAGGWRAERGTTLLPAPVPAPVPAL